MKTLKIVVMLAASLAALSVDAKPKAKEQVSTNSLEMAVLAELNVARTKPLKYVEYLKEHRNTFDGNTSRGPGGKIRTKEGVAAVDEAIEVLSKQTPLTALEFSAGLALSALDHVEDTGPQGITGHDGADGSKSSGRAKRYGKWKKTTGENCSYGEKDARRIVMQLIIDDGVAGRGHRVNIYNKDFHVVGIACGPHQHYGDMCVMVFAGGFTDDQQAIRNRKSK